MIPYDILSLAYSLIPPQPIQVYRFLDNTTDSTGIERPTYGEPIDVEASVQSVDNSVYEQLSLDFQKNYRMVYAPIQMVGLDQQENPDKLVFEGRNWIVVKTGDWTYYNGWSGVLVVENKAFQNV